MNLRTVVLVMFVATAPALRGQVPTDTVATAPSPAAVDLTPRLQQGLVKETRKHWATVRSDGSTLHEVTTITRISEELTLKLFLVRDARGQAWQFEDRDDHSRKTVSTQITQLATGDFVRMEYKLPLEATTRSGALLEAHRMKDDPGSARYQDVAAITLSTRLTGRTAAEGEWKDRDKSAEWRSDIRTSLTIAFVDALEQMRDTLIRHDTDLLAFRTLTEYLAYTPKCDPAVRAVRIEARWPNCAFDKEFGMPCTKESDKRIERAEKVGAIPSFY
ncbi:MAG TPA: hypothetical protein VEK11_16635 [Thermoanaerobaculia bacterium]|nr:hypothetical protein [Thermoanaerobaculia bacterium]